MKYISVVLLTVLLLAGCSQDWLDVNVDPNNPSEPQIDLLLPGIQYDIADDLSLGYFNLGYISSVYTHQITTRESIDQYGLSGDDVENYWNDLYSAPLTDLDLLIELGTERDYMQYVGISKVLKAYIYSILVDLWGDVPFSEVNNIEIKAPKFDNDQEIYAQLFTMIDEGIADMTNAASANVYAPGNDDLIYGGDINLWVKAANTLKLKLYNQVRLTSLFDAAAVTALLGGDLIESADESFQFWFGAGSNPENRNPGMADEYSGAQISLYSSPWFFEVMHGENPDILTGIVDPRIPYYFANQHRATPENPSEYINGGFISIYFGSLGVNRDWAGRNTFTMVGFYPCGGRYDTGVGVGGLGADDAVGDVPMRFITYADRLYIEAELVSQAGIVSPNGTARQLTEDAIYASFDYVDYLVDKAGAAANQGTIPNLVPSAVDTYVGNVMAAYDAATSTRRFEILMTQKWIQHYGNGVDTYTDYRRTGYPIMWDPNTMVADGGPGRTADDIVPCQATRGYVIAWPYPTVERDLNVNAPPQRTVTTDGVFWDID